MLQRFAERHGYVNGERLHLISLGQGQGPFAEALVGQAAKAGHWVCLQNCHLASSWMPRLQDKVGAGASRRPGPVDAAPATRPISQQQGRSCLGDAGPPAFSPASPPAAAPRPAPQVEELAREGGAGVHPDFRLWLTSMPAAVFPVPVLQNSVKLTNEPPKGARANMGRTYNDLGDGHLAACDAGGKGRAFRALTFSLAFFHAGGGPGASAPLLGLVLGRCTLPSRLGRLPAALPAALPPATHTHAPAHRLPRPQWCRSGASLGRWAGTSATSSTPATWSAAR
jgi:dynein heavy chain